MVVDMPLLFSALAALVFASSVVAEIVVVPRANYVIKEDQYSLSNMLYNDGCDMTYDDNASVIDQVGAAFSANYTDPGGNGMDAYLSGTVGGKRSGGKWRPGNKTLTGMPVLLGDLGYDFRIKWSVAQENAWDDDDKWWATINVIFDSGTELSEPNATDRLFDIVIQLDRYQQDKLQDVSKNDKDTYWWFARNPDGSIHPFVLNIDGVDYEWGVRYKFFQNQGWKDEKVHIKFIPIENNNVAPYIDHPLRDFSEAATNFLAYVDLPAEEQAKAALRVSDPSLWVKAISAGYETYTGSSILKQTELRTVMDTDAPIAPEGLTVSRDSNNDDVILQWSNHGDASLHGYSVWRSSDIGVSFHEIATDVVETTFSDASAEANSDYIYYIKALDRSYNASPPSSTATAFSTASSMLRWNRERKVMCPNKKWLAHFGSAFWKIQSQAQCIALANSNSLCAQPLVLSMDDQNCYCSLDSCEHPVASHPYMATSRRGLLSATTSSCGAWPNTWKCDNDGECQSCHCQDNGRCGVLQ